MKPNSRRPRRTAPGTPSSQLNNAIQAGRAAAQVAIEFRTLQRRSFPPPPPQSPVTRTTRTSRATPTPVPPPTRSPSRIPANARSKAARPATAGVLLAEGDSWFDYPMNDILQILEDAHGFDVESVAHKGDCVEDMAHSPGQFEELARRLEKLLRDGKLPRAILLSGGGNDIAGDEFALLLNHAASNLPPLNEDIVRGVIDVRLRAAYASLISGITEITRSYLGRPLPVITHGYDYPVPDGRGFLGGWWFLPGPWLKPGLARKGHLDLAKNTALLKDLILRFNEMLSDLAANTAFAHVHHLDLTGTLRSDAQYKKDWANELHPTKSGFLQVTAKFAAFIEQHGEPA